MRNYIVTLSFCLSLATAAGAQAYEGKVEYQKKDEDAVIIEFPYPPSIVENAIVEKLERMGYKGKDSRGFRTYKGIAINEISLNGMDYMIKVDRKSRKEKDESVVYLVMKTTDANPLTITDSDIREKAKGFLNNLGPEIEAYNLEQEIISQEEAIKKAEKKYSNLQDDLQGLERKKKKIEDDIEDNKKDQEKQRQEIEKQKQILESIKAKRKTSFEPRAVSYELEARS